MKEIGTIPQKHSVHTLLGTIKWLREDPENRRVQPRVWPTPDPMDIHQFMAWFRRKLDEKITSFMPVRGGRKLDDDWQRSTSSLAYLVNRPRLIVRTGQVPLEFRERLAHRISQPDDL